MEFDIQRCTRRCSITGRELAPGEPYYSALVEQGTTLLRRDYSVEAWPGPPQGAIGWWKSHRPEPRAHWALGTQRRDARPVRPARRPARGRGPALRVGAAPRRRRVLRSEESETDEQGREVLVLDRPRREQTYRVPAVAPDGPRIGEIQEELARLLQ